MKKSLITSIALSLLIGIGVRAQISDLPVSASPTTICSGESSTITLTGSETNVKYSLRNSSNVVVDGPVVGTGNDIIFNTGSITGTETYNVYAEPNFHSGVFDGVSSYAQLGANNRGINSGMTIGVWIKTSQTGAISYVASKYTGAIGFLFYIDINGKMRLEGRSEFSSSYKSSGPSTTSVNDGQWHYVAGTTNGSCWNVYVDGVHESSGCIGVVGGLSNGNTAQFQLGMYNYQYYFEGEMDDLYLLNTPATAATVASYYTTCLDGTETNCTALFNFDEATYTLIDDSPLVENGFLTSNTYVPQGATACEPSYGPLQMTQTVTINVVDIIDESLSGPNTICSASSETITISGSEVGAYYSLLDDNNTIVDGPIAGTGSGLSFNTGVISSTTTFSVNGSLSPTGPANSSLTLDGIDDYVNMGSDFRNIQTEFSAGLWVKTTASGAGSQFLYSKYDLGYQSGFVITMDNNGYVEIIGKGYTGTYLVSGISSTSINDGQWHYVVGTGAIGGYFKIYVDGVLENTGASVIDGSVLTSTGDLILGKFNTTHANAEFDEVDLWNVELTQAQIQSNMNTCLDTSNPNLVAYFTLNEGSGTTTEDQSTTGINGVLTNMDPSTDWLTGLTGGCLTTNGCNLTMSQQHTITVDNDGPLADVATLATVNGQCEVTSLTSPTATDNCSGLIVGTHNATLPITSNTTVTWTYDDGDGNTTTQTQNVVIDDNTAPVPDVASLANVTAQCEVTSLISPSATDNCASVVSVSHNATLPISSNTTVTWTYDDGDGNTSTQTQNIVINDNTTPVPDVATLPNVTEQCEVTSLTSPTATDNCSGTLTGTHDATFPITSTTVVTWTYTDGANNVTTQTQNVSVNDNIAPVPTVASLPDVLDQCAVNSLANPGVTDNCSAVLISSDATLPITSNTTVTWTYTDVSGNQSTQTQEVIINDITDPVPDVSSLPDLTASCEITSLTAPTASDNCAGSLTGTHTELLPLTTSTVVTWTYDDGNGNVITQTQNVVINDNAAPIADLATLPDLTAQCEITSLTAPTATDNCAGSITATHTALLPLITSTVVTWTYDDGNGNTTTQLQNVIISDNVDPVLDQTTLNDVNETCEVTSLVAPTATDNCVGTITGTHNATLPISTNTLVTWTFDDGNGNIITQSQQINITDAIAPVADVTTLTDIVEVCEVNTLSAPTATDNCFGTVTGTHSVSLPITATTVVTWTYTDGNGNTSTQDQQVIITPVDANTTVNGITISANNTNADAYQWVDCDNSNNPITGETGQSFTPTTNGNYAVIVTSGNCSEVSTCISITTVGIKEENNIIELSVYPNPTFDKVHIISETLIQTVTVHDLTGALVQKENTSSFSIENLSPGSYTLRIKTDAGTVHKRIIKN